MNGIQKLSLMKYLQAFTLLKIFLRGFRFDHIANNSIIIECDNLSMKTKFFA